MTDPTKQNLAADMREAAARLRQIAAEASPGPWDHDRFTEDGPWEVIADGSPGDDPEDIAVLNDKYHRAQGNAWWIGQMHPGTAEPLAALLDMAAVAAEDYGQLPESVMVSPDQVSAYGYTYHLIHQGYVLARVILRMA